MVSANETDKANPILLEFTPTMVSNVRLKGHLKGF